MAAKNIVIFGETGAGKSSVINLIAGKEEAKTSPDMRQCTTDSKEYPIDFDGYSYKVFDTIGLQDPRLGMEEYLDAIMCARNLIMELEKKGGIDLLLFCVRAGRSTASIQKNYRLFYESLWERKFPIVLVLTGLEGEKNMEDWWTKNKGNLDKYKIFVEGHVCITAANNLDGSRKKLYQLSRQLIGDLIRKHTHERKDPYERRGESNGGGGGDGGDRWPMKFMRTISGLLSIGRKKDIAAILMQRYGMPAADAQDLASLLKQDLARR